MRFRRRQEFVAEFLGTMVLIMFGCGVVAMVVLFGSDPAIPGEVVNGGYTNIAFTYDLLIGRPLNREQLKESYRKEIQRSEI